MAATSRAAHSLVGPTQREVPAAARHLSGTRREEGWTSEMKMSRVGEPNSNVLSQAAMLTPRSPSYGLGAQIDQDPELRDELTCSHRAGPLHIRPHQ